MAGESKGSFKRTHTSAYLKTVVAGVVRRKVNHLAQGEFAEERMGQDQLIELCF